METYLDCVLQRVPYNSAWFYRFFRLGILTRRSNEKALVQLLKNLKGDACILEAR